MGKKTTYMHCEKCNKAIKRKSEEKKPLCLKCSTHIGYLFTVVNSSCKYCGKEFKHSLKRKRIYCSRSCSTTSRQLGKKLSIKHKEAISLGSSVDSHSFFKRVKFYEIFCPYLKKNVKVQGTYELKYAKYLNDNNISWEKQRSLNFRYSIDDIKRTYFPDFHLIETDEFIEIKGHFPEKDKMKMEAVISQNIENKFIILQHDDLELLGIDLSYRFIASNT